MGRFTDAIARRFGYAKPQRRDFAAAAYTRLTGGWNSSNTSANVDLYRGLDTLRARSRDLCNNNDYAKRFLGMVAANVIGGTGVVLQSRVYDKPNQPDKRANDAIELAWEKWGKRGLCDVTGRLSWRDLQLLVIKAVARDGECLVRKVRGKSAANSYGYALHVLDIDRLDTKLMRKSEGGATEIRMGVEINEYGRALAYWLRPYHPGDQWLTTGQVVSGHTRVPADEVLHVYLSERPEQLRGAPWLHAAMTRLQNLGGYEEAAVIAARVGASKMGFFKTPDGQADALADGAAAQGVPYTEADPGSFGVLPEGMDFVPFNPDYPHAMYADFVKAALRGIASGLGVAYHALANDLEGVNYSSIRSGTLEERDQWMSVQQWFVDAFCEPVYADWLGNALAMGQITLDNGTPLPPEKKDKFAGHIWQARRWQWVDPLKDIEAARLAIMSGIASPQMIAAQNGVDVEDVIDSIKQFEQMAAGVSLIDYGIVKPGPAPAPTIADEAAKMMMAEAVQRSATPPAVQPAPTFVVHNTPPAVTVNTGETRNEITVQPTPSAPVEIRNEITTPEPVVNVECRVEAIMPEQEAPVINVNVELPDETRTTIVAMPERITTSTITREEGTGNIISTTQTERDA